VADGPAESILRREVLEPVYGARLYYGRTAGEPSRPFVLPWAGSEGSTGSQSSEST
jgi:hypothetical protein